MNLRAMLLSSMTAFALIAGTTGAMADGNIQTINIGIGNLGDGFGDYNAVAVSALQQNAVQIAGSMSEIAIGGEHSAEMDFGEMSFENQMFSNNNFNSGVNAVQGNALAIATATNGGGGGPAFAGLGF